MILRLCALSMALALLAWPGSGRAQTCHAAGNMDMDFGTVSSAGGATTVNVPVTCRSGAQQTYFTICLYFVPSYNGTVNPRTMTDYAGSSLYYDVYGDAAHTLLIGDVLQTPAYQTNLVVPGNYVEGIVDVPVFGWVHAGQSVPPTTGNRFYEHGVQGQAYYRFSTSGFPTTTDCASGGSGGGANGFGTLFVASFEERCTVSASDLDFGDVTSLAQAVRGTSSIRVSCPAGTLWSLGLGDGSHPLNGIRRMVGGGEYITYGLYRDGNFTQPWGDTGSNDRVVGNTDMSGAPVDVTVHGQVPAQPDVSAGEYLDTVIVTLYY